MLGCLGSANYWLTLPFLAVLSVGALVMVIAPDRLPGNRPPVWRIRLLGVVVLCTIPLAAMSALDEARSNPGCDSTTGAAMVR